VTGLVGVEILAPVDGLTIVGTVAGADTVVGVTGTGLIAGTIFVGVAGTVTAVAGKPFVGCGVAKRSVLTAGFVSALSLVGTIANTVVTSNNPAVDNSEDENLDMFKISSSRIELEYNYVSCLYYPFKISSFTLSLFTFLQEDFDCAWYCVQSIQTSS
jgi:hypothetical protein